MVGKPAWGRNNPPIEIRHCQTVERKPGDRRLGKPGNIDWFYEHTDADGVSRPAKPRVSFAGNILITLAAAWALSSDEARNLVGSADRDLIERVIDGRERLNTVEQIAQMRDLADLHDLLYDLLGGVEPMSHWLREARSDLAGGSVLDLLMKGSVDGFQHANAYIRRVPRQT